MAAEPTFEIEADAEAVGESLLVGQSNIGLAGMTAIDYLVRHSDAEPVGHVRPRGLPAIAPFEEGRPRRPIRLYTDPETDVTILVSELFVPVPVVSRFVDAIVEWTATVEVGEIAALYGVPYPHGPDEHAVFTVATDEFREQRLTDVPYRGLRGGFLDGVPGELVTRGLDEEALPVGTFVTPVHPPGPDFDAVDRFLDAIEACYGLAVDRTDLERQSTEMRRHYEMLAERMEALDTEASAVTRRDYPEDRMFM